MGGDVLSPPARAGRGGSAAREAGLVNEEVTVSVAGKGHSLSQGHGGWRNCQCRALNFIWETRSLCGASPPPPHHSQAAGLSRAKLMGMTLAMGGSGPRNILAAGGQVGETSHKTKVDSRGREMTGSRPLGQAPGGWGCLHKDSVVGGKEVSRLRSHRRKKSGVLEVSGGGALILCDPEGKCSQKNVLNYGETFPKGREHIFKVFLGPHQGAIMA